MAIYLDDWSSGTVIFGNVCYKAGPSPHRRRTRQHGREQRVRRTRSPSVMSTRAAWAGPNRISTAPTTRWSSGSRRSTIGTRRGATDTHNCSRCTTMNPRWRKEIRHPQHQRWRTLVGSLDRLTDKIVEVQDNLIDKDPLFVDREHGDFRLREDSPAFQLSFKPIPVEKMGLYKSNNEPQRGRSFLRAMTTRTSNSPPANGELSHGRTEGASRGFTG